MAKENLFGTMGRIEPAYLLGTNARAPDVITVSVEPGHETVKAGTVLYRKAGSVLYAPAEKADITTDNQLVVLVQDVDTTLDDKTAAAAKVVREGNFITGTVTDASGAAIDNACDVVLRMQGITFQPMDDWSKPATEADNGTGEAPETGADRVQMTPQGQELTQYGVSGHTSSDLIGENVAIACTGTTGKVTGDIKNIAEPWTAYRPDGENTGHFFPVMLDARYEGEEITVSGKATKTVQDRFWVLRVENAKEDKFTFSKGEETLFVLDFSGANKL